ncbi:MAG: selenium-dependent molybdenum cofactor biosynthesis protein YqeB [Anaerolineales bacterium]
MNCAAPLVLIRGGGDLATSVAVRLHRCGFHVVITEIKKPLAVRRLVAFAQAVYASECLVEDVRGRLAANPSEAISILEDGDVPVMIDPPADCCKELEPAVLVDARMRKVAPEIGSEAADFVVALGPGFRVGRDCHAVVETNRGHDMGRVIWEGSAEADTSVPESVVGNDVDRVLRSPDDGMLMGGIPLTSLVDEGDQVACVGNTTIIAPFRGILRGLLHDGVSVHADMKVGDLDPRMEPTYATRISDKALAVGGGVLEAILSQKEIRKTLR